jgi:Flp pilus assembly protein TadG
MGNLDRETGSAANVGILACGRSGRRTLQAFAHDDQGAITVEFVIWVPAFVWMLAMIVDFSFIFMTNASMWDTARDATRRLALHKMTPAQAEDYVRASIVAAHRHFEIRATEGEEEVGVYVSTSINNASILGVYANLLPGNLVAHAIMLKEPE